MFPYIGNFIIPTDFHIFHRDRYTTNQFWWKHRPWFSFLDSILILGHLVATWPSTITGLWTQCNSAINMKYVYIYIYTCFIKTYFVMHIFIICIIRYYIFDIYTNMPQYNMYLQIWHTSPTHMYIYICIYIYMCAYIYIICSHNMCACLTEMMWLAIHHQSW